MIAVNTHIIKALHWQKLGFAKQTQSERDIAYIFSPPNYA